MPMILDAEVRGYKEFGDLLNQGYKLISQTVNNVNGKDVPTYYMAKLI